MSKKNSYRRLVRIDHTDDTNDTDRALVEHMIKIEHSRPHRLQEWMRSALHTKFKEDLEIINANDSAAGTHNDQ